MPRRAAFSINRAPLPHRDNIQRRKSVSGLIVFFSLTIICRFSKRCQPLFMRQHWPFHRTQPVALNCLHLLFICGLSYFYSHHTGSAYTLVAGNFTLIQLGIAMNHAGLKPGTGRSPCVVAADKNRISFSADTLLFVNKVLNGGGRHTLLYGYG